MADPQIEVDPNAEIAEVTGDDGAHEIVADVAYQRLAIVNVVFVGLPGTSRWVLIDTGVFGSGGAIQRAAERRFGGDSQPAAIILTHGHFDHVGAVEVLAARWDVDVYAHPLEIPYLSGKASYPPPDPSVGGGMMAALARSYPRGPINLATRLKQLAADGTLPGLPGWRWLLAAGHTPGQVALWRDTDRMLVAADAFITTKQESANAVLTQRPELHGPPMYFTQDWAESRRTVERLVELQPEYTVTGHGPALAGPKMRDALQALARDFDQVAVPDRGLYVANPTKAEDGTAYQAPQ